MERGITSNDRGFTLIELVIVMAVMAFLSLTAVFSVGRTGEVNQADAVRFMASYDRLRDTAIHSRKPRALSLDETGWQVLELASDDDDLQAWVTSGRHQRFQSEVRFQGRKGALGLAVAGSTPKADLVFLSDGQVTPFEASFISADRVTRCSGSGWAGLTCENE